MVGKKSKSKDNTNKITFSSSSQQVTNDKEQTRQNQPIDTKNISETTDSKTDNINDRQISVFVSSTFRDMQTERDELVKIIFPQLRKLCEERGVTWGEVDLRWGITDEQKAEGKVLSICLDEIERCRPYFICVLGERYGWVDDNIPVNVLEKHKWLTEYKGKSVTELEILHGVLRDPKMENHAFFYFRDPAYLNSVDVDKQSNYIEVPTAEDIQKYGPEEAQRRANENKRKLAELKDAIRNSGFPVAENYADSKSLGKLVCRDLKNVIDTLYPESQKLDPLQQAMLEHTAFAKNRFNVYIERKEYYDRLNAHVSDTGLPLVIVGDSGSGKSALLANWAKKYQENRAGRPFLRVHYIGSTPDSVDFASMLRHIMGEMKLHFGIQQDIPEKLDELKAAFANWLHMAAAKGKMVLIIDALNQLEDHDGAQELFWLPEIIPDNVRLVVSSLPGRSLDELTKRGWPTMKVELLNEKERKDLIIDYLKQYSRTLSPHTIEHIASYSQTSNPLYLRALLEEMRLYGDHFTLPQRIERYLTASTIADLYDKILERYEQDYDRDRKDLVKDAFSCIWAARKGLSEIDLREMLGSNGEPLPGAFWSPLYLAAEKSMVNRSGLLTFSHEYFRTAVHKRYLKTESDEQHYHVLLADYYETKEIGRGRIEDLPWQLSRAKSWGKLAALLASPLFLKESKLYYEFTIGHSDYDFSKVAGYWTLIEENSEFRMIEAYRFIMDSPSEYEYGVLYDISRFLEYFGYFREAANISYYLATHYNENILLMTACLRKCANCISLYDDIEDTLDIYRKHDEILKSHKKKILDSESMIYSTPYYIYSHKIVNNKVAYNYALKESLNLQADLLMKMGNLDGANKLYIEVADICKEVDDKIGLAASLGSQALILSNFGDLNKAMRIHKDVEKMLRELGDKINLSICLHNQAQILYKKNNLEDAMNLFKEEERMCSEIGKKYQLVGCLEEQARIHYVKGDLDDTVELMTKIENIYRGLKDKEKLVTSLNRKALTLSERGDIDDALKLCKEAESIGKELDSKEYLAVSLMNQALILTDANILEHSLPIAEEALTVAKEHGDAALVSKVELNLKKIYDLKHTYLSNLTEQYNSLFKQNDLYGSLEVLKEVESIYRETSCKKGVADCLEKQGLILRRIGDLDSSMKLFQELEEIFTELGDKGGIAESLGYQASILRLKHDIDGSIKMYKKQEEICTEAGKSEDLVYSLINQALCLMNSNKQNAVQLAENALRIANEHGYLSLTIQIETILDSLLFE